MHANSRKNRGGANSDFFKLFQEILHSMQQNVHQQNNYRGQQHSSGNSGRGDNVGGSRGNGISRKEAFEILGLQENAGEEEIRTAYKKLIMKNHPDSGGSSYLFRQISDAKKVLLGEK